MKALKTVWVISDGKPGHYNQSRGVLLALKRLYEVRSEWIEVRLRSGLWRKPLTALLNATQGPLTARLLNLSYSIDSLPNGQPDLLVVAGGRAVFAAILLARCHKASVLYCGSLRGLHPRHFTAAMTLERQADHPANLVLDVPPTLIDRQDLERRGMALRNAIAAADSPLWAILVGGDGAGYHYTKTHWQAMGEALSTLACRHSARLLITTSRRTGALAEQALREALAPQIIADAVWYASAPRPITQDYLGAADAVVTTIDSMSMIMETVAAGRPLLVIEPSNGHPDERYANAINRLSKQRRILRVGIDRLPALTVRWEDFSPLVDDPADLLAARLAPRLGIERIG